MTPESAIERLEAAEKAMTPGDWRAADCIQPKILLYTSKPKGEGPEIAYSYCDMDGKARGNLKGIALLRNAAPALLAGMRALERLIERAADAWTDCDCGDPSGPHDEDCVMEDVHAEVAAGRAALASLAAAVEAGA